MERTVVILKPDAIKRGLEDEIIKRYKKAGLNIIKKKRIQNCSDIIKKHYPNDEEYLKSLGKKSIKATGDTNVNPKGRGKEVLKHLRNYMTSGPVTAMVIKGENAIQKVREITGYTDPINAKKGTIRGDLGNDSIKQSTEEKRAVRNLVHASGDKEEAEEEMGLWFGE